MANHHLHMSGIQLMSRIIAWQICDDIDARFYWELVMYRNEICLCADHLILLCHLSDRLSRLQDRLLDDVMHINWHCLMLSAGGLRDQGSNGCGQLGRVVRGLDTVGLTTWLLDTLCDHYTTECPGCDTTHTRQVDRRHLERWTMSLRLAVSTHMPPCSLSSTRSLRHVTVGHARCDINTCHSTYCWWPCR